MRVIIDGLPAAHPDAAPVQTLIERIIDLTQGQKATVALSALLSLYRQALLNHPNLHEVAIEHLVQITDELRALKGSQAAAQPAPAVATAAPAEPVEISLDEMTPEMAAVVERLAPFITSQGWPHHQVLPALFFIFYKAAVAHPCCLETSADLLQHGAALLRNHLQSVPEAERAGQPLH